MQDGFVVVKNGFTKENGPRIFGSALVMTLMIRAPGIRCVFTCHGTGAKMSPPFPQRYVQRIVGISVLHMAVGVGDYEGTPRRGTY
jgi:hypothetical protein